MPLFICYPKCTTCKKALHFLEQLGIEVQQRDIAQQNPTKEELLKWIEKSGLDFKKFFNTSGQLYRQMELKDKIKTMTQEEAVNVLATNGMLVKRPILVTEDMVLVGFKEDAYKQINKMKG